MSQAEQQPQQRNINPNNPMDALIVIDGLLQPGVAMNRSTYTLADMCIATLHRMIQRQSEAVEAVPVAMASPKEVPNQS